MCCTEDDRIGELPERSTSDALLGRAVVLTVSPATPPASSNLMVSPADQSVGSYLFLVTDTINYIPAFFIFIYLVFIGELP